MAARILLTALVFFPLIVFGLYNCHIVSSTFDILYRNVVLRLCGNLSPEEQATVDRIAAVFKALVGIFYGWAIGFSVRTILFAENDDDRDRAWRWLRAISETVISMVLCWSFVMGLLAVPAGIQELWLE